MTEQGSAAGWFPDPWTSGQQRYWDGDRWTADVFTPGWEQPVANDGFAAAHGPAPIDPAQPPPPPPTWVGGRPSTPAEVPATVPPTPAPPSVRPLIIGGVVAAALAVLLAALVVVQADRDRRPVAQEQPAPAPSAPPVPESPGESPSPSPSPQGRTVEQTLADLVVRQRDVPRRFRVSPIPGGTSVDGGPTMDLCDGVYPSENRRIGRLQTEAKDRAGTRTLSTEAVQYDDDAATAQAFREVEAVAESCQDQMTMDLATGELVSRSVSPEPTGSWRSTPGVERLAYRVTQTAGDDVDPTLVVYLRRGPLLLGLYFPQPDGRQMPVEGRRTVPAIVKLFEERLLDTPPGVPSPSDEPSQSPPDSGVPGGPGEDSPGSGVGA